jgi:uncharacterized protein YceK
MRPVAFSGLAAVCFLTGCGTLSRIGHCADPTTFHKEFTAFYPATDYDVVIICKAGRSSPFVSGETSPGVGWGLIVPFHTLDLPISLGTDTLCLPWDIVEAIERHKEQTHAIHEEQGR